MAAEEKLCNILSERWQNATKTRSYQIRRERLTGTDTTLTSFLFNRGANFYCLSYKKDGSVRHTLIDAADSRYRSTIVNLLKENDILPTDIERIILTHHHLDHCGSAALLAGISGAEVLVHPNFKKVIEGTKHGKRGRWAFTGIKPFNLLKRHVRYLSFDHEARSGYMRNIGGINLPILDQIQIGDGMLEILGYSQEDKSHHTSDQLIVQYTPRVTKNFKPTDQILFTGDLWLMNGPLTKGFGSSILENLPILKHVNRYGLRILHRQDLLTKEGLKNGFILIRVLPGHGEEFIGSRILKNILSKGDILVNLGFTEYSDRSILNKDEFTPKINEMLEQSYFDFVQELILWHNLGYGIDEIFNLIIKIYTALSGGTDWVRADREEKRMRLKEILKKLAADKNYSDEYRRLAATTYKELEELHINMKHQCRR